MRKEVMNISYAAPVLVREIVTMLSAYVIVFSDPFSLLLANKTHLCDIFCQLIIKFSNSPFSHNFLHVKEEFTDVLDEK